MIAKNDRLRLSADEWPFSHSLTPRYLNRFTGDGQLFPPLFRDLLFPLFCECMQPENTSGDARVLLVLSRYADIMRGAGHPWESPLAMAGVCSPARQQFYAHCVQVLGEIVNGAHRRPAEEASVHVTLEPQVSADYKPRLAALREEIAALQAKIDKQREPSHEEAAAKTSMAEEATTEAEAEADMAVEPEYAGHECLLVLLPLLTTSLRHARFAETKMAAISFLADLTQYLPDTVILQSVLPFLVNILDTASTITLSSTASTASTASTGEKYGCVVSHAIRAITAVLKRIHSLPHADFNVVTDYVIPAIARVQRTWVHQRSVTHRGGDLVQLTIAECLADLALSGKRLLNVAQREKITEACQRNQGKDEHEISVESGYREDMQRLRNSVKELLSFAMCADDEVPAVGTAGVCRA